MVATIKVLTLVYKRCIFLRVNIKTTCFGHIWPSCEILIDIKPNDGHIWPKHVLILTLKNMHLLCIVRVVFLTTLPPI